MLISRNASPDDARAVATIHVRSWQAACRGIVPSHYLNGLSVAQRESAWRQRLESGKTDTWLVEDEDRVPVGWISVGPSRDADAGPTTGELYAIYVDPSCWGRGIGGRLWRDAEARMKSAGESEVTLWVLKQNDRAIRFYRSHGFAIDGEIERTVDLGGSLLTEIRLRKSIGG